MYFSARLAQKEAKQLINIEKIPETFQKQTVSQFSIFFFIFSSFCFKQGV